ncbi:MAG: AAA family ATPase [Nocardiopsaceae bacterium]|nr:AAA family ATPase [Nocardiopsaceae bacterium]
MHTVVVSQTDPRAMPGIAEVLSDPRYGGIDLYLHIEPGYYREPLLRIDRHVIIVPTEGPGTVTIAGDDGNTFRIFGRLECYGVEVGNDSTEYPPVYVDPGGFFKAIDCTFTAPKDVEAKEARLVLERCVFQGGGASFVASGGSVASSRFEQAMLSVSRGGTPVVSDTVFTGCRALNAIYVSGGVPMIRDCRITGAGTATSPAVYIGENAKAEMHGCEITGSRSGAVEVTRARVTLTNCRISGGDGEANSVGIGQDGDATLIDCDITDSSRVGIMCISGKVTCTDVTITRPRASGVSVRSGAAELTRMAITGTGLNALLLKEARAKVAGLRVEGGADARHTAVHAERSRLELHEARITDSAAGAVVAQESSSVAIDSIAIEGVLFGLYARDDSTLTASDADISRCAQSGVLVGRASHADLRGARVSDCAEEAVRVSRSTLRLRDATIGDTPSTGVAVLDSSSATVENTTIARTGGSGALLDADSRLQFIGCTIKDSGGPAIEGDGHPGLRLEATETAGGSGGDRVRARAAAGTGGTAAVEEGPEPLEKLLAELDTMVGLEGVKREVRTLVSFQQVSEKRRQAGLPTLAVGRHLVFSGPPGTGKTTVARLYGRILRSLGVLERGQFVEASRADLVAEHLGGTTKKTTDVVEKARGGVLFIDEAYALTRSFGMGSDFGQEAVDTLIKLMEDMRDEVVVIFAGYSSEMREFLGANPGLRSRVSRTIDFANYSSEELTTIFRGMAATQGYVLGPGVTELLTRHFQGLRRDETFGNGREARRIFESVIQRQAVRLAEEDASHDASDLALLTLEDLDGIVETGLSSRIGAARDKEQAAVLLDRLHTMVGLDEVKREVAGLIDLISASRRRKAAGLQVAPPSRHLVFAGPPGTGKTTVARIYGELLAALGVLAQGQIIEAGRADLVGRFVGETAQLTRAVFDSARGGVLFIDEAYALTREVADGGHGFGREAVDTLIKLMEDHRDEVVVIVAGYTDEMRGFMSANPGLASRFSRTITFAPYSVPELVEIFRSMAVDAQFLVPEETMEAVTRYLLAHAERFAEGNAREIRTLFEAGVTRQSRRIERLAAAGGDPSLAQLQTLLPEDIGTE